MNDDFEVDDILNNLNKREKRKNTSKRKGNRGENQLADVLEERFPGRKFFRVVGSGNRWSQVDLSEENRGIFTGDIVCPSDFLFCMECKYGYDDFEICGFFGKSHPKVDEWLDKVKKDATSVGKQPMLCWRKPRYPWLAFINCDPNDADGTGIWTGLRLRGELPFMRYKKDWLVVALDHLLSLPDSFWFNRIPAKP